MVQHLTLFSLLDFPASLTSPCLKKASSCLPQGLCSGCSLHLGYPPLSLHSWLLLFQVSATMSPPQRGASRPLSLNYIQPVHSFIPQIFTEHLLCAQPCSRHWEHSNEKPDKPCPHEVHILVRRETIRQQTPRREVQSMGAESAQDDTFHGEGNI